MRMILRVFAAGAVATAELLMPTSATAASTSPFAGAWESLDAGDGSYQTLNVYGSGARGTHATRLHDTVASQACNDQPANAQGPGVVTGVTMTVRFTITCPGSGKPPINGQVGPIVYTYDPGSGTMTDDSGTLWNRVL